ncbi:Aste57867_9286 [Aphanomyces stellatus]|uniref:Aste57867_9286 protein n=1 Tax=Aphanomyces stellatus TaxID=120398 RepID=A0A485KMH7_9STRA|nr:hypothetical protein As57867_009250 [Aphanomyces stellatus]VFT86168.1 Aste57867_9286 [Aphanomyces stellatus]
MLHAVARDQTRGGRPRWALPRSRLIRLLVVGVTCLYVFVGVFVLDSVAVFNTDQSLWSPALRRAASLLTTHADTSDSATTTTPVDHVAIVGYVPNTKPEYVTQATRMLWASWNYSCHQVNASTRNRTDLIFFVHTSIADQMPPSCTRLLDAAVQVDAIQGQVEDQCYVIEHSPPTDDFWHRNKFFHSLTFLAEPVYRPLLTSYARLLRTDVDCAITPAFLTYRPDKFVVGKGGYMKEKTKPQLLQVVAELEMMHQGLHNIGSTWFGDATLLLDLVPHMLDVAEYILTSPVHGVEKGWPLWHIPVTSMYAGEITINHYIPKANLLINDETIDVNAISDQAISTLRGCLHHPLVDAYQGRYFDKWAFKRGEYTSKNYPRSWLNISIVQDYMMIMVLYESPPGLGLSPPQPDVDNVAIVTYVPHTTPEAIGQASHMLWASWNYARRQVEAATRNRTDLILFAHKSIVDFLPSSCLRLDLTHPAFMVTDVQLHPDDQCYVVTHASDETIVRQPLDLSLTYLTHRAYRPLLTSYARLLRTDVDCAVTPAFLKFRPARFVVSRREYMTPATAPQLRQVASELMMTHQGLHNIGATWFGDATLILDLVPKIADVATYILAHPAHRVENGWPLWHLPLVASYATEIAVNSLVPNETLWINDDAFDVQATAHDIIATVYHIECVDATDASNSDDGGQYFDKWAFKRGEYTAAAFPQESLNFSIVRDYVMAMALYESPTEYMTLPSATSMDNVAIVAYVPATKPEYLIQANRMLWASWEYARRQVVTARPRTDLIFFVHADVDGSHLPPSCLRLDLHHPAFLVADVELHADDQCYVIVHASSTDGFWTRHTFYHSLAFLTTPLYRPLLLSYQRLLRTDLDCAITPAFLTYRPDEFVVGNGGYVYDQTKHELLQVATELNLTHHGRFNVGSTWFGPATVVLDLVDSAVSVAKYMAFHPVHSVEKGWPLWHVPVLALYAGDIVVNNYVATNLVANNGTFDVNAIGDDAVGAVYHIHALPGVYDEGTYFTKSDFERGEYNRDKYPRTSLDMSIACDYMMAIVLYGG